MKQTEKKSTQRGPAKKGARGKKASGKTATPTAAKKGKEKKPTIRSIVQDGALKGLSDEQITKQVVKVYPKWNKTTASNQRGTLKLYRAQLVETGALKKNGEPKSKKPVASKAKDKVA